MAAYYLSYLTIFQVVCLKDCHAIAAGNCAVVKPSEITTGAIPGIIALVNRIAGLDLAVLVEGNSELSSELVKSELTDYVSFQIYQSGKSSRKLVWK